MNTTKCGFTEHKNERGAKIQMVLMLAHLISTNTIIVELWIRTNCKQARSLHKLIRPWRVESTRGESEKKMKKISRREINVNNSYICTYLIEIFLHLSNPDAGCQKQKMDPFSPIDDGFYFFVFLTLHQ